MSLKKQIWLLGKVPGSEHYGNEFSLPGDNRMTPAEAAYYLGLSNLCYMTVHGYPKKPYDYTLESLTFLDRIIWSVEDEESAYEVARVSKYYDNVVGALVLGGNYDEILGSIQKWTFAGTGVKGDNTIVWTDNADKAKGAYIGVNLWDYKNGKELDEKEFETYIDKVFELLADGEIKGVFINSNCVMDIGLKTVEILKEKLENI
ncbi:MAG: hypothetical protein IKC41_06950 [Clostridia bacterium]|nr:hypothetical protein [Clostridia bacterium]